MIDSINNEGNPERSIHDIRAIILHHTGVDNGNSKDFLNKTDYISVHYLVSREGKIYCLMNENIIAYHCGDSYYNGLKQKNNSLNWCTIGIEVEGYQTYTSEQKESVKKLLCILMDKYNIDTNMVLRHKDIAPRRKIDIHDNFWNNEYESFEDYKNHLKNNYMDKKTVDILKEKQGIVCSESISVLWNLVSEEKRVLVEQAKKLILESIK